jgi:hypothetical protein
MEEKCSICGSEEFEVEDFGENFTDEGAEQWWDCKCEHGHRSNMYRVYTLNRAGIIPIESEEE